MIWSSMSWLKASLLLAERRLKPTLHQAAHSLGHAGVEVVEYAASVSYG
ncbi:MAG: hypothetical protein U1G07_27900 [Verrucomicrobiota bacterium]